MPPSKKKATGKGAHASQNRPTGMASASSNNSITVASITVSRDVSDVSDASSRPSSPTSPSSIPEEEEEEEPNQLRHSVPALAPEAEVEPEGLQDQNQNQKPDRHPAEDHDMDLGDVNGVAPNTTSSGPLAILESLPVAPVSNAIPYPLGVESSVLLPPARTGYEKANLDEITVRQLNEDAKAYHFDLNFCRAQLDQDDLTPQESRTFQLRILDLTHQIRHCQHRIESLRVTMRGKPLRGAYGVTTSSAANPLASTSYAVSKPAIKRTNTSTSTPGGPTNNKRPFELDTNDAGEPKTNGSTPIITKRPKIQLALSPADHDHDTSVAPEGEGDNTTLQRLGYWRCRLCEAPKYLLAPAGRSPAMPCKWPLKDISKMITHFTEMHAEHSPTERCKELGQALAKNRGPFEYWLRRTRAQNVGDGSIMDEVIHTLDDGKMPTLMRKLSRAAAGMPSS